VTAKLVTSEHGGLEIIWLLVGLFVAEFPPSSKKLRSARTRWRVSPTLELANCTIARIDVLTRSCTRGDLMLWSLVLYLLSFAGYYPFRLVPYGSSKQREVGTLILEPIPCCRYGYLRYVL